MLIYKKADILKETFLDSVLIPHCCNDVGRFGAGFALGVAKKWPQVRETYLAWYRSDPVILEPGCPGIEVTGRMGLGECQIVMVEPGIWVVNIIGQHGMGMGSGGRPPIRYDAIRKGLTHTCRWASNHNAKVCMPKIGSGLAGGNWSNIEAIIRNELVLKGVETTVYYI